jgi:hypothetical protein
MGLPLVVEVVLLLAPAFPFPVEVSLGAMLEWIMSITDVPEEVYLILSSE